MRTAILVLGAISIIIGLLLYGIFRIKNKGVTFKMEKLNPALRRNGVTLVVIGIILMGSGWFAPQSLYFSHKNDTIEEGNKTANKYNASSSANSSQSQSSGSNSQQAQQQQQSNTAKLANQNEYNQKLADKNAKRPYSQLVDARMQSALARQPLEVHGQVQQVHTVQIAGQSGTGALVNMNGNLYVVVIPSGFVAQQGMYVQAQTIMTGQLLVVNANAGKSGTQSNPTPLPVSIATNMTEQKAPSK